MSDRPADRIALRGLRVRGFHGVLPSERAQGQDFLVDAVLHLDVREAAASDDLEDTVDYGALAVRLAEVVAGEPVDLIETLAERLAAVCLRRRAGRHGGGHRAQAGGAHPARLRRRRGHRGAPVSAVLSLGSNLGDRRAHLRAALDLLEPVAVSPLYETAPVGGVAQDDFLNLVAVVPWDAAEAWRRAQRAEQAAGRLREVRWGPRTLDVDVVVADGPVPADLVLPHPRAHERAFVLRPWLDVDPDAALPQGRVADLLAALGDAGVRRAG